MPTSSDRSVSQLHSSTSYWYMLGASFAFASMGAFAHKAGESANWQLIAVARATVACFFAYVFAKTTGVKLVFRGSRTLWIRSVVGSLGMICNFYALAKLPVSDVLTLMNTTPVWVTILLWVIFKQKPTVGIVGAIFVSMIGIFLIQQPHFQGGKFACLMALIGSVCTSIAMLGLNRLRHIDHRAIVVHFSAVSSVATCIFMLLTVHENIFAPMLTTTTNYVLLLVGFCGVLGQIGMTMAFAKGHAARISIVGLSQILFGLIYDIAIWRHPVNFGSLLGMALVAAPTAWLLLSETPQQSHDIIEAEMS